jgi:hypothetical protein
VNLPAKLGHHFFEGRTFGPFEHVDQLGNFDGCAGFLRAARCDLLRGRLGRGGFSVALGARLASYVLSLKQKDFNISGSLQ